MEEEKIDRILKLVDMLEVTDENRDDIAKVKKLIEQKKYAEMLEVLKKVTSKNETKIKEDNRTILFEMKKKKKIKKKKNLLKKMMM
jgi:tRNA uridine 5-carbamoylmethylation protein Kti12